MTDTHNKNSEIDNWIIDRIISYGDNGDGITEIVRNSNIDKSDFYKRIESLVYKEKLSKADVYFTFDELSQEFEFYIETIGRDNDVNIINNDEILSFTRQNITRFTFDVADLEFYLYTRNCHSDFQNIVVEIERILWNCTFAVLNQYFGDSWIVLVDVQKRQNWASVREDFRMSSEEAPIHQFTSIPDLRDIILSSKFWPKFCQHIPKGYSDKKQVKDLVNKSIIPIRNRVFHPTRELSLSFSEHKMLKTIREKLDVQHWRDIDLSQFPALFTSAPPPKWF